MSAQTPVVPAMVAQVQSPVQKIRSMFGKVVKGLKTTIMALVLLIGLWVLYVVGSRAYKTYFGAPKQEALKATFSTEDVVSFTPKLGQVTDVRSDRTADALLSGTLGPAVVLFGAEWCAHCRNMEPSFQAAAKASDVPFVRIDGASAPVTSQKFSVTGYPTIFGLSSLGLLSRYGNARTTEGLLEFAGLMVGKIEAPKQVPPPAPQTYQPYQALQAPTVPPQVAQWPAQVHANTHPTPGVHYGVPLSAPPGAMVSTLPSSLDAVEKPEA